ncbi:hypothetical protein CLU79DRAFT_891030 [Phycomyces nitens]|nr:hypothetical protein CLU79DRAFT_891030 [Phycomyces nitens]
MDKCVVNDSLAQKYKLYTQMPSLEKNSSENRISSDEDEDSSMSSHLLRFSEIMDDRRISCDGTLALSVKDSEKAVRYSTESLYSYSFTPLSRDLAWAREKRNIMAKGIDFIKRMRGTQQGVRELPMDDYTFQKRRESWNPQPAQSMLSEHTEPSYFMSTHSSGTAINTCISDSFANIVNDIPIRHSIDSHHSRYLVQTSSSTPVTPSSYGRHKRALHTPTRFLPQNQSVLTTNSDGQLLVFNDIASLYFGIDKTYVKKSILSILEEPFRQQIKGVLKRRKNMSNLSFLQPKIQREPKSSKGIVLVCGTVVPILKVNGQSSIASLWLKERRNDSGKRVYIWIFEEIYESSLSVYMDPQCVIQKTLGEMRELYGFEENSIVGKHISVLIPALSPDPNAQFDTCSFDRIKRLKFFASRSKNNICFPVMTNLQNRDPGSGSKSCILKIISLPTISGLVTVHDNGTIQSMSPVPAKYLFGYPPDTIVDQMNISTILPQFPLLIKGLRQDQGVLGERMINNLMCRKILGQMAKQSGGCLMDQNIGLDSIDGTPKKCPESSLPVIFAVHRDGSKFDVELQIHLVEFSEKSLTSIWVTYNRMHALSQPQTQPRSRQSNNFSVVGPMETVREEQAQTMSNAKTSRQPRFCAQNSGIISFGSYLSEQKQTPMGSCGPLVEAPQDTQKSEMDWHPLDDYVILNTLGQGTYGTAQLGYRKDDSKQARGGTKVVIKSIDKARILVEAWTRDRRVGLIPTEIHVLKYLQNNPHDNCCRLLTSMEDNDNYYVVMELLGDGMDLFDYIELNEHMTEKEIKRIFRQTAEAVGHLHRNRIIHRDIKDENIILDGSGTVQLIDFGCAAYSRKGKRFDTFTGTLEYCAPEVLKGVPYEGPPQDIWSLGILLYTLVYRENPFYSIDEILEGDLRVPPIEFAGIYTDSRLGLLTSPLSSKGHMGLLRKMLERRVEIRYTIDQVLSDPWLQSAQI